MNCPEGYVKYEFEAILSKAGSSKTTTTVVIRTSKEFLVMNCNIPQFESQRVGGGSATTASSSALSTSPSDVDRSSLSWKDPSALFPSPPTSPLTEISTFGATATVPTGPQHSIIGTWAKSSLPIVVSVPSANVQLGESVPVAIQMNHRPSTSGPCVGVVLVEGRVVVQQYREARSVHTGVSPKKVVQKLITVPLLSP